MQTNTLPKLPFVLLLAVLALPPLTLVHAQQPQAQRPAAAAQIDLTGKWRFSSFGSFWNVDLKLDAKKSTVDEKAYCGEAVREQTMPDTPVIKTQLCAVVDPKAGQLLVEVQGAACKAPWRSLGMLDGTCSKGSSMRMMNMDNVMSDSISGPMGGFTAIRLEGGARK